jgi:glycosyltransferase involved in cell wall biosynthesis
MTRLTVPQIVVWHDCVQLDPKWKPWKKPTRFLLTLYKYHLAIRRARGITNSEYTKREVLKFFPRTDPARLTPLWLGVRGGLTPALSPWTGPLRLPLRCVYVGALEGRKNVFSLLSRLPEIFGDLPFKLDLAGKYQEEEGERASALIAASPYAKNVRLRGLVSEEELRKLMGECEITLFPSLGEGFGLPVAEAMMQGHVVFAFRNTCIPEVGGNAIVLAENDGFAAWGEELRRLLNNPDDCADLRRRAVERSRIFSRESMKTRFRNYFEKALGMFEEGRG